ncbi:hypothetical protein DTO271D3_7962 [Paecilomyces variotii]|nr:hypothetical protein DTO169E5_4951 [Paecilomyces variotii]KAJ9273061.1 hypothetical protein DTO212C5_646 [Paecilomyces variotii]KAJ9311827.1 hypothetical protein DTO271D3_7962 [Paecilomyces variotii]
MRLFSAPLVLLLGVASSWAADDGKTTSSSSDTTTGDATLKIISATGADVPTGPYQTYSSTIVLSTTAKDGEATSTTSTASGSGSDTASASGTATGNSTDASAHTTTSASLTMLVGGQGAGTTTLSGNATATGNSSMTSSSTSQTPLPTNTQPCNGYPEFCTRNYSNITMVAAHNSPFVRPGNWASNQALPVTTQLNDGIRMLQFQTHWENNTIWLCHTSCDILNAGTLESYLVTVTQWLRQNPYDVLTILMGNSDFIGVGNYSSPIESSGLIDYVYTPPRIPMGVNDWPTLSSMILSGKRVVVFLDYQANQTEVPYVIDEFGNMFETPFSPTDRNFPCTVQRPPNLPADQAEDRLYMANHNLNLEVSFAGINLLIPNSALLDETNGVSGYGSLGWMAENCTRDWNRPPNFLLVDYYNYGTPNGSVFEVAADMNNVTWNGKCCGTGTSGASALLGGSKNIWLASLMTLAVSLLL